MANRISTAVILTALGLEREALVAHLEERTEREHMGTIYDLGVLRCSADLHVAVAEIGAGNVGAGVHVERAKNVLEPDLVAFVGVAGGIKDVDHGDVVIASKVSGYESGKAGDEFLLRPEAFPLGHRIEQRTRQAINSGAWLHRLAEGKPANPPKAVLGPIVAGDAVVHSTESEIYGRIRQNFNDTVAVEMEGRGLFVGAHLNDSMPAVVVRGISDLIDDKGEESDARWQPIAAANAAAFAVELLCGLAGEPNPIELGTHEELQAITASLSNAYYLNIDRLLSDPTALGLFSGWVPEAIRGVRSWAELGFAENLQLRHACELAIERWTGSALPLKAAIENEEIGSRVAFDGRFRTRNWKKYDPEVGLTGDLEMDPLVYIDVGERRVFMPIDPRWATTSTGRLVFQRGSIQLSGVALLRDVDDGTALASPYLFAPPVSGRRLSAAIFGDH